MNEEKPAVIEGRRVKRGVIHWDRPLKCNDAARLMGCERVTLWRRAQRANVLDDEQRITLRQCRELHWEYEVWAEKQEAAEGREAERFGALERRVAVLEACVKELLTR